MSCSFLPPDLHSRNFRTYAPRNIYPEIRSCVKTIWTKNDSIVETRFIWNCISLAYSFPLLMTAGVNNESICFIGQNVTTEVCKFEMNPSPLMIAYVTLLFVIMVVNICLTTGL